MSIMVLDIIKNSFWGLRREYFVRNLIIGGIFSICVWFIFDKLNEKHPKSLLEIVTLQSIVVVNGLLYPYAKFLYDYIWEFFIGDSVYVYSVNPITLYLKFVMRCLCWMFAIILSVVALPIIYLKNR